MKITFWCELGNTRGNERTASYTPKQLGFTEEEWKALSVDEKTTIVEDWANECFNFGYDEEA